MLAYGPADYHFPKSNPANTAGVFLIETPASDGIHERFIRDTRFGLRAFSDEPARYHCDARVTNFGWRRVDLSSLEGIDAAALNEMDGGEIGVAAMVQEEKAKRWTQAIFGEALKFVSYTLAGEGRVTPEDIIAMPRAIKFCCGMGTSQSPLMYLAVVAALSYHMQWDGRRLGGNSNERRQRAYTIAKAVIAKRDTLMEAMQDAGFIFDDIMFENPTFVEAAAKKVAAIIPAWHDWFQRLALLNGLDLKAGNTDFVNVFHDRLAGVAPSPELLTALRATDTAERQRLLAEQRRIAAETAGQNRRLADYRAAQVQQESLLRAQYPDTQRCYRRKGISGWVPKIGD